MMNYRIFVADGLDKEALDMLRAQKNFEVVQPPSNSTPEQISELVQSADAILVRSATKLKGDLLKSAKNLKVIGRGGIGVDNVSVDLATQMGIVVMNTPDENTITTAEHAISMMMSAARRIPQATASMKTGAWEKKSFTGTQLFGKTLGIVGLGRIGKIVANRGRALGMTVIGFDPYLPKEVGRELDVSLVSFEQLLTTSDFISIHTPLSNETRNLFDDVALEKLKPGCILVNCARGGIVNEAALVHAIQKRQLAAAALDVFEKEPLDKTSPLLREPNIILTPHLGAQTEEAQKNVSLAIARQVIGFLTNGEIVNAVNVTALSREAFAVLHPFFILGWKLGSFLSQLAKAQTTAIRITYDGEIASLKTEAITNSVLHGFLKTKLCETVNAVNARYVAKERNIEIVESHSETPKDFTSLITVSVNSASNPIEISGTLFDKKEPRIVKINNHFIEAIPEGHILVLQNHDRPGVIGKMGVLLGRHGINISRMELGKRKDSNEAISLINIDASCPESALQELTKSDDIISVDQVTL